MTMPLRCFPSNCKSVPEVLSYKWGRCEEIQNPPMAFLPSCAAGIAVMVPLYYAGANQYECGRWAKGACLVGIIN